MIFTYADYRQKVHYCIYMVDVALLLLTYSMVWKGTSARLQWILPGARGSGILHTWLGGGGGFLPAWSGVGQRMCGDSPTNLSLVRDA